MLALIIRTQPVTAHQVHKTFEDSPISSINASKGQIYPAIRRLQARGMLAARPVAGDRRGTEELSVTELGGQAVRAWIMRIDESHIMVDDPIRTRVLSFDILSREEQLTWIAKAKELVKAKRNLVDAYNESVNVPHQAFAYASVMTTLDAKMETLDDLLYEVAASKS